MNFVFEYLIGLTQVLPHFLILFQDFEGTVNSTTLFKRYCDVT